MGRLKSETIGEDVISYYYDANGNRTLMNNDGNITSYTYDKNNRLLTESANGETITYTYDANGNTLTAGEKEYTYNSRGQQIGYTDGTVTATYAYNPSGLRSAKTVGGSTKYFIYHGMQIVFEYEDSVSDGTTYYYGLNRTHSSDGDIFVYNAHGDTVQLVNNNAVVVSYTYDAFGNLTNTVGNSDNAFLYCSEYFDAETETYYLRARYYNPANGRFTQQDAWAFMDPTDPLTLNLYTYCANNPVLYVDPSGNAWYHWALGAVIVAACAVAVVATAGGAAAGIAAVASVASGTAAATAASTVAAGAFIGSATVYGTAALYAAGNSSLESPEAFIEDFNEQGNWGTVAGTAGGAIIGGAYGYAVYRDSVSQSANNTTSKLKQPSNSQQNGQNSSNGGVCFVAGTLISTFSGQKSIENVQTGDQVWAADPATGEVELKSVARTFVNESNELIHVYVAGEEILTTPSHPFWVPEKGWTSAIQLRAGDILVLLNGEYVVVEKIQHEILESPISVYNFEVEDYHTYFVGDSAVFVHNACSDTKYMSNQEKNQIITRMYEEQKYTFQTREQAESFVTKYFSQYPQEQAYHRGPQGWHWDSSIKGAPYDHINLYNKASGINIHIYWEE